MKEEGGRGRMPGVRFRRNAHGVANASHWRMNDPRMSLTNELDPGFCRGDDVFCDLRKKISSFRRKPESRNTLQTM
jgi:hypothetical protein